VHTSMEVWIWTKKLHNWPVPCMYLSIRYPHHAEARCYPKKKMPKKTLQIQKI
jgi:hypothetical protein